MYAVNVNGQNQNRHKAPIAERQTDVMRPAKEKAPGGYSDVI